MGKAKKIFIAGAMGLLMFFSAVSYADVGNINRYDSGGSSSSYGGYSGSSGGGYSRSYGRRYYGSYRSGSLGDIGIGTVGTGLIIAVVIIAAVMIMNKKSQNHTNHTAGSQKPVNPAPPVEVPGIAENIQKTDPNFSGEQFLTWAKEVYVKLQTAWTKKDWSQIRPFESDSLFEQHKRMLDEYIEKGRTNIMERISIRDAGLVDFYEAGDQEFLQARMKVVQRDYIVDDGTQQVVEGDRNRDWYMTYTLTFARKKGVKTKETAELRNIANCPSCGAPANITTMGKCEYCGSIVTNGDYGWVLINLEGENSGLTA